MVIEKWIPLKDTLGYLDQSYATLCFNWIDQTALTARYHEAIACDVVPLVWKNYDSTNILVADDWQRCFTIQEFYDKIVEVKKSDYWLNKIKEPPDRGVGRGPKNCLQREETFDASIKS